MDPRNTDLRMNDVKPFHFSIAVIGFHFVSGVKTKDVRIESADEFTSLGKDYFRTVLFAIRPRRSHVPRRRGTRPSVKRTHTNGDTEHDRS